VVVRAEAPIDAAHITEVNDALSLPMVDVAGSGDPKRPSEGAEGGYPRHMRDLDIRLALDDQLRELHRFDDDALVRHELGLHEGKRRIDVALIDSHLSGWEIKSDVDTLVRLAGQASVYGQVFDFVTIVTTARYVERAVAMLPDWWGVVVAGRAEGSGVELTPLREATPNDSVDAMSLVQLLWREEALDVLRAHGMARGLSSKARWYVWSRLAESMSLDELKAIVRQQIRGREEWPGGQLLPQCGATLSMPATR
jgi:hypothetical protein